MKKRARTSSRAFISPGDPGESFRQFIRLKSLRFMFNRHYMMKKNRMNKGTGNGFTASPHRKTLHEDPLVMCSLQQSLRDADPL